MNRIPAILSAAALLAVGINAQCQTSTGTSILGTMTATLTGYPVTDEGLSPETALGFNFDLNGTIYTHYVVDSNGVVYLTDGVSGVLGRAGLGCDTLAEFAGVAGDSPRFAPYSDDFDGVDILVDTSVANEVKVTWVDYTYWLNTDAFDMSVIIRSDGTVQFDYGTDPFVTTNAGVGVSNGNAATASGELDLSAGGDTGADGIAHDLHDAASLQPYNDTSIIFIQNGLGGWTFANICGTPPNPPATMRRNSRRCTSTCTATPNCRSGKRAPRHALPMNSRRSALR